MRYAWVIVGILVLGALAYADAAWWSLEDARLATKLEMQVAADGSHIEFEYHLDPGLVPAPVVAKMRELYPGLPFVGAEKEWHGDELFWELSVEKDGRKAEAMFTPDGTLREQEIEIPASEAPEAVRQAIQQKYPTGTNVSYEKIVDAAGAAKEYHVKLTLDERPHKIVLAKDGTISGAFLELIAEVEVPIPPA